MTAEPLHPEHDEHFRRSRVDVELDLIQDSFSEWYNRVCRENPYWVEALDQVVDVSSLCEAERQIIGQFAAQAYGAGWNEGNLRGMALAERTLRKAFGK